MQALLQQISASGLPQLGPALGWALQQISRGDDPRQVGRELDPCLLRAEQRSQVLVEQAQQLQLSSPLPANRIHALERALQRLRMERCRLEDLLAVRPRRWVGDLGYRERLQLQLLELAQASMRWDQQLRNLLRAWPQPGPVA